MKENKSRVSQTTTTTTTIGTDIIILFNIIFKTNYNDGWCFN